MSLGLVHRGGWLCAWAMLVDAVCCCLFVWVNRLFVCLFIVCWSDSRTTGEEGGSSQSCGEVLCVL